MSTENNKKRQHQELTNLNDTKGDQDISTEFSQDEIAHIPKKVKITASNPRVFSSTDLDLFLQDLTVPDVLRSVATFEERVEKNLSVVDKTDILAELIQHKTVSVIGPRRFGKTFNITKLKALFTKGKDWWNKHCKHFAIISKHSYDFPQHPVVRMLEELLIDTGSEASVRAYLEEYRVKKDYASFQDLFGRIIRAIVRNCGKGLVVLIDEYDSPLTNQVEIILGNGSVQPEDVEKDEKVSDLLIFLKDFLSNLKSLRTQEVNGNFLLRFTYLTGIVQIAQLGLFSGPNDAFCTLGEPEFASILGYTEEDILNTFRNQITMAAIKKSQVKAPKDQNLELANLNSEQKGHIIKLRGEIIDEIRVNYNGYIFHFLQKEAIYSPYAINCLFDRRKKSINQLPSALYSISRTI